MDILALPYVSPYLSAGSFGLPASRNFRCYVVWQDYSSHYLIAAPEDKVRSCEVSRTGMEDENLMRSS